MRRGEHCAAADGVNCRARLRASDAALSRAPRVLPPRCRKVAGVVDQQATLGRTSRAIHYARAEARERGSTTDDHKLGGRLRARPVVWPMNRGTGWCIRPAADASSRHRPIHVDQRHGRPLPGACGGVRGRGGGGAGSHRRAHQARCRAPGIPLCSAGFDPPDSAQGQGSTKYLLNAGTGSPRWRMNRRGRVDVGGGVGLARAFSVGGGGALVAYVRLSVRRFVSGNLRT
jgi:hypothetical protein